MKLKKKDPIQLIHFKMRVRMVLAKSIKEEIESLRISKENFAKLMHKQPSQISKWIGRNHNFTIDTLREISFRIRTPITKLLNLNQFTDS